MSSGAQQLRKAIYEAPSQGRHQDAKQRFCLRFHPDPRLCGAIPRIFGSQNRSQVQREPIR